MAPSSSPGLLPRGWCGAQLSGWGTPWEGACCHTHHGASSPAWEARPLAPSEAPCSSTQIIARPTTALLSFRISDSFERPPVFLGTLLLVIKRCSSQYQDVFSHIHSFQVLLTWRKGARLSWPCQCGFIFFKLLYEDCVLPINSDIFRF